MLSENGLTRFKSADHLLCTCVTSRAGASRTHTQLYIYFFIFSRRLTALAPPAQKKNVPTKMCYWKTAEQFCLMTIPITRSTVNMQALCWVSRGRELFCGNKQRRKRRGGEWSTWAGTRRFKDWCEGWKGKKKKKITHTHTHKHKSTAVTSCWVRSRKQKHKDGIKTTQRCSDAECPRSPCDDLWFDLTVKCPSWWSGKWMKRYSVATSCMIESPRNSILWLWPLDEKEEGRKKGMHKEQQGWGELFTTVQIFTLFF